MPVKTEKVKLASGEVKEIKVKTLSPEEIEERKEQIRKDRLRPQPPPGKTI